MGGGTRSRHLRGVAADLGISDPGERMKYLSLVKTMYNAGLIPKLGGLDGRCTRMAAFTWIPTGPMMDILGSGKES